MALCPDLLTFLTGPAPTICSISSSFSPPTVGLGTVIKILDSASLRVFAVLTGAGGTPANACPNEGMPEKTDHLLRGCLEEVRVGFGSAMGRIIFAVDELLEERDDCGEPSVVLESRLVIDPILNEQKKERNSQ